MSDAPLIQTIVGANGVNVDNPDVHKMLVPNPPTMACGDFNSLIYVLIDYCQ